jgi:radical SAM superfamily enzyme YgiQ (UPF0313 family)
VTTSVVRYMSNDRRILLVQLPIPPAGPGAIEGNVPLAAAYLKLYARRQGLDNFFDIELLPVELANRLGDQGLVAEIVARRPWMVGFTCCLWNVQRTLWIAQRLKERRPELKIVLGGPEITADNAWVLQHSAADYAVLGEGEATFAELLSILSRQDDVSTPIAGLWQSARPSPPEQRAFLPDLDAVSSPYVEGILDAGTGNRMMLETVRGCRFRCKYCYYPKTCNVPRLLSTGQIVANLNHAIEHGMSEVVFLDPTLNGRPDFTEFLNLLARVNAKRQLSFFGELRAEGIDLSTARLLRQANFHEVEIGLQSVEPKAWELMNRPTNPAAFQQGVEALLAEGIKVQVDLILGLPGDTADSVRRGIDFLVRTKAYTQAQVFNLSILPGTAFRQEAEQLGLVYQPWPPYYVLKTPTLDIEQMYELMEEAEEAFGVEFDPLPPPRLDGFAEQGTPCSGCRVDVDASDTLDALPSCPSLCFTLWLRSANFHQRRRQAAELIGRLLSDNPHTTLAVILEPTGAPEHLTTDALDLLMAACYQTTTYLDRYYSLHPGQLLGSKRLFVLLPLEMRERLDESWRQEVAEYATPLWSGNELPSAPA